MVLIVTTEAQPPKYLNPMLRNLAQLRDERFLDVMASLQERLAGNVYTESDKTHILRVLLKRADENPTDRIDIITTLGQIERAEAVPTIMRYAESPDTTLRIYCYQALGWIGDARALPLLKSRRSTAGGNARWMIDYAIRATDVKARMKAMNKTDRFALLRQTLATEKHWLVRSDVVRYLSDWPGNDGWTALFDAFEADSANLGYTNRIQQVIGQRYVFDHSGFFTVLRARKASLTRLMGLQSVETIISPDHLGEVMAISESDPDKKVAERAGLVAGKLMSR
jgi:hypothetical protein